MRVCVFEDPGVRWLEPLTLTRPAFDLLCGASTLLLKQRRCFPADDVGALVRPELADMTRMVHPGLHVNDGAWLRAGQAIMVNARWLPPRLGVLSVGENLRPHVGMVGEQLAYAVLPADCLTYCSTETLEECLQVWRDTLPQAPAGGFMIDYPWDLVERHGAALLGDFEHVGVEAGRNFPPANLTVIGPTNDVAIDPTAEIEPLAIADTTRGPIIIAAGARIQSFSRIEGPAYIGPGTWVVGAKVRGSSIGPVCRVGGEVEASVMLGHTNKYHEGFLGHSVVGEWVNLAAGCQISDLRNDYGQVMLSLNGTKVTTGLAKVGAFIGDFTRLGLSTLINTGSAIGCFANLLPTGRFLPREIPSFTSYWNGELLEQRDLDSLFDVAAIAMQRRSCTWTGAHVHLAKTVFEQTAGHRRRALCSREQRRLRHSA